tara:strand:+ start:4307 stop:4525 length:219 start_codon:yes stop_codon:yes gene_type:complete
MNPTLNSHTHCQAAQSKRTSQSLSKSVSAPTHGQQKKKYDRTTLCISNSGLRANLKRKTINQRLVLSDSLVG